MVITSPIYSFVLYVFQDRLYNLVSKGDIIAGKITGTTPLLFFIYYNTTCTNHAQVRCKLYKTKTIPLKEELK